MRLWSEHLSQNVFEVKFSQVLYLDRKVCMCLFSHTERQPLEEESGDEQDDDSDSLEDMEAASKNVDIQQPQEVSHFMQPSDHTPPNPYLKTLLN